MPNWCANSLTIHASKDKIDAIVAVLEKNNSENGLLKHLHPEPDYEDPNFTVDPTYASETNPEFRMPTWWDWRVQNWGTKWDIDIQDWDRPSDTEISLFFDSAWSPPTGVYEHISNNGYTVEAYYHEMGCAFCGKYTTEDGDEVYSYDLEDIKTIDQIPDDIIDYADLRYEYEQYQEELMAERLDAESSEENS